MVAFLPQLLLVIWFSRRAPLEAENLLLRQQLVVLRRKSPKRVSLWNIDRLRFVWLYRLYPSLLDPIIIVQPETVIRWHRRDFRAYWHWKSRHIGGRPCDGGRIRRAARSSRCARRPTSITSRVMRRSTRSIGVWWVNTPSALTTL